MTQSRIVYLASELGTLSGTFVYREVVELRRQGVEVLCFSTKRPAETIQSEEARDIVSQTVYLYDSPVELLRGALRFVAKQPLKAAAGLSEAARDLASARYPSFKDRLKGGWHQKRKRYEIFIL